VQVLHHPRHARRAEFAPAQAVLREAERLVEAGVKELLVISQDTSAYGTDWKDRTGRKFPIVRSGHDLGQGSAPGCGCTTSTPTRMCAS
jgi:hypothetical protein